MQEREVYIKRRSLFHMKQFLPIPSRIAVAGLLA